MFLVRESVQRIIRGSRPAALLSGNLHHKPTQRREGDTALTIILHSSSVVPSQYTWAIEHFFGRTILFDLQHDQMLGFTSESYASCTLGGLDLYEPAILRLCIMALSASPKKFESVTVLGQDFT